MVQSDRPANIRQEKYHKYTDPEIWDNIPACGQHIPILLELHSKTSSFPLEVAAHVKCKQAIKWRCWLHLPRSKSPGPSLLYIHIYICKAPLYKSLIPLCVCVFVCVLGAAHASSFYSFINCIFI